MYRNTQKHIYIYTYIHTYIQTDKQTDRQAHGRLRARTHATYVHLYMHTHTHTYMYVHYIQTDIRIGACARIQTHARSHALTKLRSDKLDVRKDRDV